MIPYAFVDVDKIKGMRGIYIATQLTPGPVGKRHLLSLITYNRGGSWQRIRSPTMDIRGARINCYLVSIAKWCMFGSFLTVFPFLCFDLTVSECIFIIQSSGDGGGDDDDDDDDDDDGSVCNMEFRKQ